MLGSTAWERQMIPITSNNKLLPVSFTDDQPYQTAAWLLPGPPILPHPYHVHPIDAPVSRQHADIAQRRRQLLGYELQQPGLLRTRGTGHVVRCPEQPPDVLRVLGLVFAAGKDGYQHAG